MGMHTLVFNTWLLGPARRRRVLILGWRTAAPKTLPTGWGLRPPPFEMFLLGRRGSPDPRFGDFRPAQKPCVKHPRVGVNYRKLNVYLRAKLECLVSDVAGPLIWWMWGGFRSPRGGCAQYSGLFVVNSTLRQVLDIF